MRKRKISVRGLLADPKPNSLDQHNKNCIAESKENYSQDLGSESVKG